MAAPGVPQNFNVQTANQQVLASWSLSPGATSYIVQRSLDNITFTTVATITGSPLATQYLDTAITLGTQYWYKVASSNGIVSPYTIAESEIPTTSGEMTLSQIRLKAQQRADKINSPVVTITEWNSYINQSMYELYDLLVTTYEDYFMAPAIQFTTNGSTQLYPLPNGSNTFTSNNQVITPLPLYKLLGVDLSINNGQNAYVALKKFNFIDRNKYVYQNTSSTAYGTFNMEYRLMGSNIEIIPTPASGQAIRLWYIPRLVELLQETDTTSMSISGWIEYVIVKAAYYALTKEESDTTSLVMQLGALQKRIEESAANRDVGQPDVISNTRNTGGWGSSNGFSSGGF